MFLFSRGGFSPPFQLANPPRFQANHIPKRNLVSRTHSFFFNVLYTSAVSSYICESHFVIAKSCMHISVGEPFQPDLFRPKSTPPPRARAVARLQRIGNPRLNRKQHIPPSNEVNPLSAHKSIDPRNRGRRYESIEYQQAPLARGGWQSSMTKKRLLPMITSQFPR